MSADIARLVSDTPQVGAWLATAIAGKVKVITEYRQCSAILASDSYYNELTVWSLDEVGGLGRIEYMEQLRSNPSAAALRHNEIVERLVAGRELLDPELQS